MISEELQMSSNEKLEREREKSEKCRKAYVERVVQPTLEELSEEFGSPRSTIGYWSASQNWSALRSAHQETRAQAEAIVGQAASRTNLPVVQALTDAILALIQALTRTILDIDHDRAPSTRSQILNTCSFAIKNAADACKNVGIVGMPKSLKDVADQSGGWTPALTQQINIMLGEKGKSEVTAAPGPEKSPPAAGPAQEVD